MAGSSLRFAPPVSAVNTPSRFVEGETSQGDCFIRDDAGCVEAPTLMARAPTRGLWGEISVGKRVQPLVMACLTGGNPLKGTEPDLDSGDESSEDEEGIKMSPLHSTSGTSLEGDNESDGTSSDQCAGDGEEEEPEDGDQCVQPQEGSLSALPEDTPATPSAGDGIEYGGRMKDISATGGGSSSGVQGGGPAGEGSPTGGGGSPMVGGDCPAGEGALARGGGGGRLAVGGGVPAGGGSSPSGGVSGLAGGGGSQAGRGASPAGGAVREGVASKKGSLGREELTRQPGDGEKDKDKEPSPQALRSAPPRAGSQCLPGRKAKATKEGEPVAKGEELAAKGREPTAKEGEVAAKEGEPARSALELTAKEVELAAKEGGPAAKGGGPAANEGWSAAKGAKSIVESPRSPFKLRAKRQRGPSVSDDTTPSNHTAPENIYSAEKTTYKELSEIGGVSGSPAVAEGQVRTRARTAKEAEHASEESPSSTKGNSKRGEKGKGRKVGGAVSVKRRRGAT